MDRTAALAEVRSRWREIIPYLTEPAKTRVNAEKSWVCPICGHGTGSSGNGSGDGLTRNPRSKDGNGLKCFGCGFSGDIIDLFRAVYPDFGYSETLTNLAGELGIVIDSNKPTAPKNDPVQAPTRAFQEEGNTQAPPERKSPQEAAQAATEQSRDLTPYFETCRNRLNDPAAVAYLTGRGISIDTARDYWVGYDPKADPADANHPTQRIIIPTSPTHYIGRAIDPKTAPQFRKMNNKGAHPGIFNWKALYSQGVKEVFVVEGAFDALSILEAETPAIALNSTTNGEALLKLLEKRRTEATLFLAFDNDPDPETAKRVKDQRQKLEAGLTRLGISFVVADICEKYKDANEFLTHDRPGFMEAVKTAKAQNSGKPDNTAFYISHMMGDEIEKFRADVKTGYVNLDQKSGGLYAGLYVVAAISSLGKTTFCHQMADQIAAAGNDVLYFSLEQSRLEMVTKSLARMTAQKDLETAVTSLSIRRGYLPAHVKEAAKEYQERMGDRISIVESNLDCSITTISDYIRRYIARNGVKPVVFLDYLQILQPEERNGRRQTTKEVVDETTTQLKRMSRELGLTVIAISSVNRANYLTPISFEALKESGAVEYTADVVWGLQLHCLEADPVFDKQNALKEKRAIVQEEKAKNPRSIDLVCLKNRYGIASYSCSFEYYPANDLFRPVLEFEETTTKPKKAGRKIGG
ncbi:MAG: toprim domain-containing protein [Clostridiales bacterium]|nr:toprim domain-containing protein [Clostridiales bacterium]